MQDAKAPDKNLLIKATLDTLSLETLLTSAAPSDKRVFQSLAQVKSILLMELGAIEVGNADVEQAVKNTNTFDDIISEKINKIKNKKV